MEQGELLYAGKYSGPELRTAACAGMYSVDTEHDDRTCARGARKASGFGHCRFGGLFELRKPTRWAGVNGSRCNGALLGKSEEAEALFAAQKKYLDAVAEMEETGKTGLFFYINSAGQAVCRSSSDYVSKMIALPGERVCSEPGE